jgi:Ca2+:H+ antiporter
MVEGSIVGSFLCGLLALPGISMLSDGLKRTESNFNAKSAGITSTLLIVALIVAFTPTIFQKIFGTFDLVCTDVGGEAVVNGVVAKGCGYVRSDPAADFVYNSATKYLMYICTAVLLLTYAIGLMFTLMTHAHTIYPSMVNQRPKKGILSPLSLTCRYKGRSFE